MYNCTPIQKTEKEDVGTWVNKSTDFKKDFQLEALILFHIFSSPVPTGTQFAGGHFVFHIMFGQLHLIQIPRAHPVLTPLQTVHLMMCHVRSGNVYLYFRGQ